MQVQGTTEERGRACTLQVPLHYFLQKRAKLTSGKLQDLFFIQASKLEHCKYQSSGTEMTILVPSFPALSQTLV